MTERTTLIIILFSLFYASNLCSQSFTDEGNQWATYTSDFMGNINITTRKIEGDTLINGIMYKKMWRTYSDPIDNNWTINQFIRQDSTKKVFQKRINFEEELMYDFGLELGDTIYSNFDSSFIAKVEAVDSITLDDGTMRRRVNIKPITMPTGVSEEFWIDGIGGVRMAFFHLEPFWVTDFQNQLRCFSSNGNFLYTAVGNVSVCYSTTPTDDFSKIDFEIYPNPSSEFLHLKYDESIKIKAVRIFNLQGHLVHSFETTHQLEKIDISNLSSGAFFLQLINDEGITRAQRFLKL